jgi:hypothetical protein
MLGTQVQKVSETLFPAEEAAALPVADDEVPVADDEAPD